MITKFYYDCYCQYRGPGDDDDDDDKGFPPPPPG